MAKKVLGRPFEKGVSGNPSGRPKVPAEVKKLLQDATPDAIRTIIRLSKDATQPGAVQLAAANSIADRVLGKPTQPIAGDEEGAPIGMKMVVSFVKPDDNQG